MKNSSSEFTKTHKIDRNWNFIKYKSIQISTNAFINSSNNEGDEMGWITVISHSMLYIWKVTSGITQSCTSPSQPQQPCWWLGRRECRLRLCNSLCRTELMLLRYKKEGWRSTNNLHINGVDVILNLIFLFQNITSMLKNFQAAKDVTILHHFPY